MAIEKYEKLTELFKDRFAYRNGKFDFSPYDEVKISRFMNCSESPKDFDEDDPFKLNGRLIALIGSVVLHRNSTRNLEIYLNNKPTGVFLNAALYNSILNECNEDKDFDDFLNKLKENGVIEAHLTLYSKKQIRLFTMVDDSLFEGLVESIRDSFEEKICKCFDVLVSKYNYNV